MIFPEIAARLVHSLLKPQRREIRFGYCGSFVSVALKLGGRAHLDV